MSRFKPPESEESVACNLIPMIDIMFLLLLFFMLSADMSQREIEDITMPVASEVKEDPKQGEGMAPITVNLVHYVDDKACAEFKLPEGCRKNEHWIAKIRGHDYVNWKELDADLAEIAKTDIEKDAPPGKPISARVVMLRADANAPYGQVQRVIQSCAKVLIYKIEVGAAKLEPDVPVPPKK